MTARPSRPGPEQEGYDARTRGLDRTANPYTFRAQPRECAAWARGFAAARTDLARARRKPKGDTK